MTELTSEVIVGESAVMFHMRFRIVLILNPIFEILRSDLPRY